MHLKTGAFCAVCLSLEKGPDKVKRGAERAELVTSICQDDSWTTGKGSVLHPSSKALIRAMGRNYFRTVKRKCFVFQWLLFLQSDRGMSCASGSQTSGREKCPH